MTTQGAIVPNHFRNAGIQDAPDAARPAEQAPVRAVTASTDIVTTGETGQG